VEFAAIILEVSTALVQLDGSESCVLN